jgi:wobble nucleotide-excising tRNase
MQDDKNDKIPSIIEQITLNAATFDGEIILPTLINFFYGNNGTGKSTIAKEIGQNNGLTWQQGKSETDFNILVYSRDFVEENFQSYGNLKGVFTIGKHNIEIQKKIADSEQQKGEADRLYSLCYTEKGKKEAAKDDLRETFQNSCWNNTKKIRKKFYDTQEKYKKKAQFAEKILEISNPTRHDIVILDMLYSAFDSKSQPYKELEKICDLSKANNLPEGELMAKSILSSADTPFADFVKALGATDWVRHGHEKYNEISEGKCPYCQQSLPEDFEIEISACYDIHYQRDIDNLKKFRDDYVTIMQSIADILKANMQDTFPKLDLSDYKNKLSLLERIIEANMRKIEDKINEPSSVIRLEDEKVLCEELNIIIDDFNLEIQKNNSVANARQQKQAECKIKVWEFLAHTLNSEILEYKENLEILEKEISTLNQQMIEKHGLSQKLENKITNLNKQIVSTKPTIDGINNLLRESGFQGFILREKTGHRNAYERVKRQAL